MTPIPHPRHYLALPTHLVVAAANDSPLAIQPPLARAAEVPPSYTHLVYCQWQPVLAGDSPPVAHSLSRRVASTALAHRQKCKAHSSASDVRSPTLTCARPCSWRGFFQRPPLPVHNSLFVAHALLLPYPGSPILHPRLTLRVKRQRCNPASYTDIRPHAHPDAHLPVGPDAPRRHRRRRARAGCSSRQSTQERCEAGWEEGRGTPVNQSAQRKLPANSSLTLSRFQATTSAQSHRF